MKPMPLLLLMVALATHSIQAQDVVVYAYNENLNNPVIKPFGDREISHRVTLEKNDNDQTPNFTQPIGNFLNILAVSATLLFITILTIGISTHLR